MGLYLPIAVTVLAFTLPDSLTTEQHELWYYSAGAIIFCLCGLGTGYFIWRRSHLQFVELRHEKKHSASLLEEFREETEQEKRMIEASSTGGILPEGKKKDKKKKKGKKKRKKKEQQEASVLEEHAALSSSGETSPIEPVMNPVAKVVRSVTPLKLRNEAPKDKSLDDLFS